LIEGRPAGSQSWRQVVFGEAMGVGKKQHTYVARSDSSKCMLPEEGTEARCFDLKADPGERNALPPSSSAGFAALAEEASRYRERAQRDLPKSAERSPIGAPDTERERQLRALGYIE
jgi:hypothetical protein